MRENLKIFLGGVIVKTLRLYLLFGCFILVHPVSAQNDTTRTKEQKRGPHEQEISLFGSDDVLNISISFDLGAFLKKTNKTDSFDGEMIISPGEADSIHKEIKLKYRGISRGELCSFPPIEINFTKPLYADSGRIKKLKLVTHCEPSVINDDYVIREYLVYKLFNAMTDTSLRVRLLKVNYTDINKKKKTIVKYGIFIEPVEMLAKRTKTMVIKATTLNENLMVPGIMDRLAIFNYMVANWDWSVAGQHNVKVLKPIAYDAQGLGIVVPYDFDLTGVVNADYAIPPPNMTIVNVRERIFSGVCRTKEVYMNGLREFINGREKIFSAVSDCPQLSQRSKKDVTMYLNSFFDQLEKPKDLERLIENFATTCKY